MVAIQATVARHEPRLGDVSAQQPMDTRLYRATRQTLLRAERELTAARAQSDIEAAFVQAHIAALRFAAAALSLAPPATRQRNKSAWVQLAQRIPQMSHWAQIFDSAAPTRARLEVGLPVQIDSEMVDKHLSDVDSFAHVVWDWVEEQTRCDSKLDQTPWRRAS